MAETKLEEKRGLEERWGLEEKWNEGADVPSIAKICLSETLNHEVLFHRHLQVETDCTCEDGKEAADESMLQRGTQKSDQEASVDGMAHGAIGAGHDQRVVLFDCGRAAPVFTEYKPGPDAEAYAADRQAETCQGYGEGNGEHGLIEPGGGEGRTKEQIEASRNDNRVLKTGR